MPVARPPLVRSALRTLAIGVGLVLLATFLLFLHTTPMHLPDCCPDFDAPAAY